MIMSMLENQSAGQVNEPSQISYIAGHRA